jgi:polyhydroxyalkanoate synthase
MTEAPVTQAPITQVPITQAPGPLMRRGPRPLLLHLTLGMLKSQGLARASESWNAGSPNSNVMPVLEAALTPDGANPAQTPPDLQNNAALIAGIAAYRRHPWTRDLPEPPVLWTEGETRLLDYGPATGIPVLFVPSLVNRAYVLDLATGHSMLRFLAAAGIRPLLLDWGWPGQTERRFTLTDYIAGRLERALLAANRITGTPPVLAGYCMGGTLAVAAATRRPDLVRGLALLATPWDFHSDGRTGADALRLLPLLEVQVALSSTLPIDALQTLFAMIEPFGVGDKYRAFGRLKQDSAKARLFVALEDWLNDGVPLAAPVARECIAGWYGANSPGRGEWQVAGLAVDPSRLRMPAFVAVPGRDRIVPPASSLPLAKLIPGARLHTPAAGHIGMTVGMGAEKALWQPLLDWLHGL